MSSYNLDLSIKSVINGLINRKDLNAQESAFVMDQILNGIASETQIAAIITLLRAKGETSTELSSIVQTMWEHCPDIGNVDVTNTIDTCGTGGDNSGSINISTAASIVLAACGVKVAKHGNKAQSSKCGAADVLQELGISTALDPKATAKLFNQTGYCFLFAPTFHAGMRHAAPVRAELGVRTTFNFLGPLANPYRAPIRLHGVSDPALVYVYAQTLKELGVKKAFVFCGYGGIDELSLAGLNVGLLLNDDEINEFTINSALYGFKSADNTELVGGDASMNAQIIKDVFAGNLDGPYSDVIKLNAAVGLYLSNGQDIEDCVEEVDSALSHGKVTEKLQEIASTSQTLESNSS